MSIVAARDQASSAGSGHALVPSGQSLLRQALMFARKQPVGAASFIVLVLMIVIAIGAPLFAPYEPNAQILQRRYAPLFSSYVLGGDQFGRDILSRIIYGARISLLIGLGATIIGGTAGAVFGIVSGYFGGRTDMVIQRIVDTLQSIPTLVLAMVLVVAFSPSVMSVILAVAVPTIPLGARVIRSVTLQVKSLDYVSAALALGASHSRVMRYHILPQTIAPLIIILSSRVGQAIITEATLGFIGLGVPPPTATWGQMLSDASKAFFLAPWISIIPGIALSIAVFAVNLLGDAIRDTIDPRLRGG